MALRLKKPVQFIGATVSSASQPRVASDQRLGERSAGARTLRGAAAPSLRPGLWWALGKVFWVAGKSQCRPGAGRCQQACTPSTRRSWAPVQGERSQPRGQEVWRRRRDRAARAGVADARGGGAHGRCGASPGPGPALGQSSRVPAETGFRSPLPGSERESKESTGRLGGGVPNAWLQRGGQGWQTRPGSRSDGGWVRARGRTLPGREPGVRGAPGRRLQLRPQRCRRPRQMPSVAPVRLAGQLRGGGRGLIAPVYLGVCPTVPDRGSFSPRGDLVQRARAGIARFMRWASCLPSLGSSFHLGLCVCVCVLKAKYRTSLVGFLRAFSVLGTQEAPPRS